MVVHYKDLGVPDPKGWNRAHAKCSVYEYNTSAGSFYYQPMLDYIEKKRFSGEDSHTISARKMMAMAKVPVELPNALDFSRRPVDDLPNANLNLDRTVGGFNAIQMKQRNVDRIHVKTELVRGSKSAQTIDDQKTSTMIRDRYINELAYYNKIGVGRTPAKFEESFFEFKTEKFL